MTERQAKTGGGARPGRGAVAHVDRSSTDPEWWRGAVIYQIYPRSFQDTSGDGVGDLRGITERLGHVAALGVDAIWISPFFRSPMHDFGYDVSDYRDVDPMFGLKRDFDDLVAEAHALGLKVMIDLVMSHTSIEHPWFTQSRADRTNERADWYVWADPKPDGGPPNNWLSIFGGPAWRWDARRCQYYLHNFLDEQPDLNFHNPAVRAEMLDVARYWLERGVDGFRLDVVNFYFHSAGLENNPALGPEYRNATIAPAVNPYNHQFHLYDKNRPENLNFLAELRALMDEYGAAAVGEVGDAQNGLAIAAEYTSGDRIHMAYAFEFLSDAIGADHVRRTLALHEDASPDAWGCWAFSNHDVPRVVSRWGGHAIDRRRFARFLNALLLSLRGSVCLYQGEELGWPEAELAYEDIADPYGRVFWPEFKGRDGCRTPIAWDGSHHGGFSTGEATWLPVSPDHRRDPVSAQEGDPRSVLEGTRAFLAFRAAHPALRSGACEVLEGHEGTDLLVMVRGEGADRVLCAFNFGRQDVAVALPTDLRPEPLTGHGFSGTWAGRELRVPAQDAFFARLA